MTMKKKYYKLFTLLLTLFLASMGCKKDNDCDSIDCIRHETFSVSVIDNNSQDLIGIDKKYHPDSIKMYSDKGPIEIDVDVRTETLSEINMRFDISHDNQELYLELDENDTDTLFLNINKYNDECCNARVSMNSVKINGKKVNTSYHNIVKN